MTDDLIWICMFIAAFGIAGIGCWAIDRKAKRNQDDWQAEGNARPIR